MADSDAENAKDCDRVTCSSETCGSETSSAVSSEQKLKSLTLPHKLDIKQIDWDELDDLLQVRQVLFLFYIIFYYRFIYLEQ